MELNSDFQSMADLNDSRWRPLSWAGNQLCQLFNSRGYTFIDPPILESSDLFLRAGGGEMANWMYSFLDPGGNHISLRPEFTSSIVRHSIDLDSSTLLPFRIQYQGPVFRYAAGEEQTQSHQAGVELIGSGSPQADAEIITLGCLGLSSLGLKRSCLVLSDLGLYNEFLLAQGLSERGCIFVLSQLGLLQKGQDFLGKVREDARKLGLVSDNNDTTQDYEWLGNINEPEAKSLVIRFLNQEQSFHLGQREPDEVAERLLKKLRGGRDGSKMDISLEFTSRLALIRGGPNVAISQAKELMKEYQVASSSLDRLQRVLDLVPLDSISGTRLVIDFGLARGIAYYSGIVFEMMSPDLGMYLGGGGRYDNLASALGSPTKLPALGFAYNLEQILSELHSGDHGAEMPRSGTQNSILVVPANYHVYPIAMTVAQELRVGDTQVEVEVCERPMEDSLAYARAKGIRSVVRVTESGERDVYDFESE